MYKMFKDCVKLEQIDLNNLDTSKVDSMNSMFLGCSRLEKVDLSGLDTRKVTDMNRMFYEIADTSSMFASCGTDHVTVK